MNALLLSAGYGKRMRPLTLKKPKCLMQVNRSVLLEIWIKKFLKLKVNDIIVNTHHLAKKVETFTKKKFKDRIILSYESKLLGTAKTIINNYNKLKSDDCIIVHSDNYCEDSLKNLLKSFKNKPKNCLVTMMVFRTNFPETCGIVKVNKHNVMTNFYEKVKNPPDNLANCAVYIFSRKMIKMLKDKYPKSKDISNDIIPNLVGKINIYETNKIFYDISTKIKNKKTNA